MIKLSMLFRFVLSAVLLLLMFLVFTAFKQQPSMTTVQSYLDMTPVPTMTPLPDGVIDKGVDHPAPGFAPKASDPWVAGALGWRTTNTKRDTGLAALVVSGTVKLVAAARWTTTDGSRPPNPFVGSNQTTIFRPATISVKTYLKGTPLTTDPFVFAQGGTIGQDSFTFGDDLYDFQEGQNVITFLYADPNYLPQTYQGATLWRVLERYTITADGNATNTYRTIPVQTLLSEISGNQ